MLLAINRVMRTSLAEQHPVDTLDTVGLPGLCCFALRYHTQPPMNGYRSGGKLPLLSRGPVMDVGGLYNVAPVRCFTVKFRRFIRK